MFIWFVSISIYQLIYVNVIFLVFSRQIQFLPLFKLLFISVYQKNIHLQKKRIMCALLWAKYVSISLCWIYWIFGLVFRSLTKNAFIIIPMTPREEQVVKEHSIWDLHDDHKWKKFLAANILIWLNVKTECLNVNINIWGVNKKKIPSCGAFVSEEI